MVRIGFIGLGAFGFALLKYLDLNFKHELFCFDASKEICESIKKTKKHPYFYENTKINNSVTVLSSSTELIKESEIICIVVSSKAFTHVLNDLKNADLNNKIIINFSKGLESATGKSFTKRLIELKPNVHCGAMFGGTIASNLLKNEPLGMDLATNNKSSYDVVHKNFTSKTLKIYESNDLIGIELAASLKNIVSLLAGILKGLEYNTSTITYFISRASKEIQDYAIIKGASKETFSTITQSWGNDLWMSCMNKTRNNNFGYLLGKENDYETLQKIFNEKNQLVEAISTINTLNEHHQIKNNLVLRTAKEILIDKKNPKNSMNYLINML
ncbi:NAD(P)-binding domain-containing protein [Candidatus Woesearchaeota archaeon]|nr:NAD(P)-binding domain-containing protein [Candidatus Woesearchaeota archaeon]MCF7901180.1 NAD(P)-binding domain-containing protein [Candidatus Woesearchaeota archaeon]MCF8013806.1 NAD(P)-binding domain-containing protein [Candidatus Woesearchaeota archaeon]